MKLNFLNRHWLKIVFEYEKVWDNLSFIVHWLSWNKEEKHIIFWAPHTFREENHLLMLEKIFENFLNKNF